MSQFISILLSDACRPALYQQFESLQLVERTLRQLQIEDDRLLDNLPQADIMQIGSFHNFSYRRITNASCGIIDDTAQRLLVIRVCHKSEISNNILNLLTLVEAQAAIDAIWDTVLTHLFLKRATLGIGTIEDSEITERRLLLSADALDIVTNDDGFLSIAVGRLQRQSFTLLILAEYILTNLSLILAYQAIGSLYNELCRAVVLLQLIQLRTLIHLLEVEDIVDVSTTEAVDTLCIVAHHTHMTVLLCQLQDNLLLGVVGILVLIYQHVAETLHILLADVLMMFEQQEGLHQQVVKVHCVSLATALYVPIIYMCHLRTLLLCVVSRPRALHILLWQQQVVLRHRDTVSHR